MLFRKSRVTRKMMLHLMHHELGPSMTGPEAEAMIRQGAMVNAVLSGRDTLLSLACIWGNRDVVRALLHYGADANGYRGGQSVPLHIASQNGHTEVMRMLVANGADLDRIDAHGNAPLHRAVTSSGVEARAGRLLIELGANPWVRDRRGLLAGDLLVEYLDMERRFATSSDADERVKVRRAAAIKDELAAITLAMR